MRIRAEAGNLSATRERIYTVLWPASAVILPGALLGVVASAHPHAAQLLAELAALAGLVVVLRKAMSPWQRAAFAGAVIGLGETTEKLGSASSALFALAVVAALPWPSRACTQSGARAMWMAGSTFVALGLLITAGAAHVPTSVILFTGTCLWAAGATTRDGLATGLSARPTELLQIAGTVAGITVIISRVTGHALVTTSATMARDALVSGGTTRASGGFTSPNEAGMILSAAVVATIIKLTASPRDKSLATTALAAASCTVALILTGSRASVLACIAAVVLVVLPSVVRRPRVALALAAAVACAFAIGSAAGTFAGRGLNVFKAHDASSVYRDHVTSLLFERVDWTQLHGFGFTTGNILAINPVSGALPNIDEAWLYLFLTLGGLAIIGYLLILVAASVAATRALGIMGLAAVAWIAVVSPSENLFLLPGPCVAGLLLFAVRKDHAT
jgi:hypothetical protein